MGTATEILKVLQAYKIKQTGHSPDRYRSNSPFRSGSDSMAFGLVVYDDEHGAYYDHARGGSESGSLYELADRLGIEVTGAHSVASTKRGYDGLDDYAKAHGIDPATLRKLGWRETEYIGRPALIYSTKTGDRWRFLDGKKPSYINTDGYVSCWYRLDWAIKFAADNQLPLVICNGEISTIAGQLHRVPACASTGGEKRLSDANLSELLDRWKGEIILALDSDAGGREAARYMATQLAGHDVTVVDLGFGKGGDLADLCMLHGEATMSWLLAAREAAIETVKIISDEINPPAPSIDLWVSRQEAMKRYSAMLANGRCELPPVVMPFKQLHRFGGLCRVIPRRKVVGVVGTSGGGKSSLLETWIDEQAEVRDVHTLFWGPEWSAEEMAARSVQRCGGPSFTEYDLHKLWLSEEERGIPIERRDGKALNSDQLDLCSRIMDRMAKWPGQSFYMEQASLEVNQLLTSMKDKISDLSKQGIAITQVVWDYAQLLAMQSVDGDASRVPYVLNRIKSFVVDNDLVGIVSSQVTKQASRDARGDNTPLNADDAQFLRTDTMNLVLTLKPYPSSEPGVLDRGLVGIGKNSGGVSNTHIWLYVQMERLRWLDREVPKAQVS